MLIKFSKQMTWNSLGGKAANKIQTILKAVPMWADQILRFSAAPAWDLVHDGVALFEPFLLK